MSISLRRGAGLLLATLTGMAHAAAPIDPATLSDSKVTLVDVSQAGRAGKTFAAGTIIHAPLPKVCALLQDYGAYPGFMPNTTSTVVSERGAQHALIDVTLGLPMGKVKRYRLRMEPKVSAAECLLSWKQVPWPGLKPEETIVDTTGHWLLTPGNTAGSTVVRYAVHTDPGPIPFGLGWIVDSLSKNSIPQTLDAVRKRATSN